MTKSGANGPKSRARARKERSGAKYTQARRGAAAIPVTGDEVTLRSFRRGEPLPWNETVLNWQCHRCGVATDTCGLVSGAGAVRLRPYCPGCLPPLENSPALRAFADYIRDLYFAAGAPCVDALAGQVEEVTGCPATAAVSNVLTGTVLVRQDTVQALVRVLEGDVGRALQLWQAADREQSQGAGMTY
ncbi:hypothetical protein [Streptomyces sp. bgisy153]|uniref:hypothetical protein n=1 Tax=Streptomyces sp. bgisy153 TaxID=3413793 RepID=UPI003D715E0C